MEDITHMTKTNLKANHIRIENLYKSMFSEIKHTSINLTDEKISITHLDKKNQDPANIELYETKLVYFISYLDMLQLRTSGVKFKMPPVEKCRDGV